MAQLKADLIDLHESSLDGSAGGDSNNMSLIKHQEDFADENTHMVQHWSGPVEVKSENINELRSSVTYKLITVPDNESNAKMDSSLVHDNTTFYVISNPAEVFATPSKVLKPNSPKKIKRQTAKSKAITAKKRDDKRRATHNEVERRRRDKINNWIMKLAALVPNSDLPDSASKGGILAKACDHITELTGKQKRLQKLEIDNEKLVQEVLRLNQELAEVRRENSSIYKQMTDRCIAYPKNKGQTP